MHMPPRLRAVNVTIDVAHPSTASGDPPATFAAYGTAAGLTILRATAYDLDHDEFVDQTQISALLDPTSSDPNWVILFRLVANTNYRLIFFSGDTGSSADGATTMTIHTRA
jgi:hypothetical protein